jgi:MFS transporter, UMF1 family
LKDAGKLTRQERSWIYYDVGNSAFVLVVVTAIMPIFFKDVASQGVPGAVSTANWGFANSLSSFMLVGLAPILGTFADYRNFKKKFLILFTGLGIVFTLLLTMVPAGNWLMCLSLFVVAKLGFSGSNIFYDAFLVDVTPKERMDRISSLGFGWGYIGSVIPFSISLALILLERTHGGQQLGLGAMRAAFVIAGLWWLIFTIPILRHVRQVHYIEPAENPIRTGLKRLVETFSEIRRYRQAFIFLIAYFFYIDGVDTIIIMATSYGRDMGLGMDVLILAVLMVQVVAFPFVLFYGRLAERFGTRNMLYAGIGVYCLITLIGFYLPSFDSAKLKMAMFWLMAFLVATSQGGIQALSRSYFGRLIPPERSAEFFGFYNIFGKFATISGPLLMGIFSRVTGDSRYGLLSILVLFIIGGGMLKWVESKESDGNPENGPPENDAVS